MKASFEQEHTVMFQNLDAWDYVLVGIAIVVSVYSLTTLMNRRRKLTIERLRAEVETESKRSKPPVPKNVPRSVPRAEDDAA